VITDLMRVVGIDSYDHEAPLGHLLQDALALPIFGGGNIGVRRRLHSMLKRPGYEPLLASGAARSATGGQAPMSPLIFRSVESRQ
jgi:butyryl-CoA dehydrogenase